MCHIENVVRSKVQKSVFFLLFFNIMFISVGGIFEGQREESEIMKGI